MDFCCWITIYLSLYYLVGKQYSEVRSFSLFLLHESKSNWDRNLYWLPHSALLPCNVWCNYLLLFMNRVKVTTFRVLQEKFMWSYFELNTSPGDSLAEEFENPKLMKSVSHKIRRLIWTKCKLFLRVLWFSNCIFRLLH